MPRFSRGSINTTYFHVMTQGINKSYIFDKPKDIKYYIKIMYELKKEHNLEIIAYCIMNNHTHMLIHAEKIKELSKFMQKLNSKYARFYNKKYNRIGYVFRDRFKAEGIYSEKQYYTCIKYIYDNPVKAGICDKPDEYPYSDYKPIINEMIDYNYTFIDTKETKELEINREVEKILDEKNTSVYELTNNKKLERLVKLLKDRYKLSYSKISEKVCISREKVRYLYNK